MTAPPVTPRIRAIDDSDAQFDDGRSRCATAVIIGRAGSKGFPGKNSQLLAGKPIVHYSIEHARNASCVERIVVSTDCPDLASAAHDSDDNVILVDRPNELAGDTATVDSAVRHALDTTADTSSYVVILYANVPIRPATLIDDAIDLLIGSNADSVQSYTPVQKFHPAWMSKIEHGVPTRYLAEARAYRRQDLEPLYVLDGGIIAVTHESLQRVDSEDPHAFLGDEHRAIISEPHAVIDIDEPIDLQMAEFFLLRPEASKILERER